MELTIGKRIYLKSDFVKTFVGEPKSSRSFYITALTDVAAGLKNARTGRAYTISINSIADNIELVDQQTMTKDRDSLLASMVLNPPEDPIDENVDPPDENTDPPPVETFTFMAPIPTGTIEFKPTPAATSVVVEDDPFGGLYG